MNTYSSLQQLYYWDFKLKILLIQKNVLGGMGWGTGGAKKEKQEVSASLANTNGISSRYIEADFFFQSVLNLIGSPRVPTTKGFVQSWEFLFLRSPLMSF